MAFWLGAGGVGGGARGGAHGSGAMKGAARGRPQQQVHFAAAPAGGPLRHSGPAASMATTGPEICRTFAQHGSCQFGDRCRFMHSGGPARGFQAQPAPTAAPTGVCRTFAQTGTCQFGDRCRYSHEVASSTGGFGVAAQSFGSGLAATSGAGICKTFAQTGMCQYGDRCRYSHDPPGPARGFGVPHQTMAPMARAAPVEPCRNFAQFGNCKMGDRCRYSHDATGATTGFQPTQRSAAPRSAEVCRFFAQHGTCQWGDRCVYAHVPASEMSDVRGWPSDARAAMPSRRSQPCHFFAAKGHCNKGDACPYSHTVSASGPTAGEIDMGGFVEFENDESMYSGAPASTGFSPVGVPRRRLAGHSSQGFGSISGISHGVGPAPAVTNLFDSLDPQVAVPEHSVSAPTSEGSTTGPTISEHDLAAFRAARFEYGSIPEVEPPVATASGGSVLLVG